MTGCLGRVWTPGVGKGMWARWGYGLLAWGRGRWKGWKVMTPRVVARQVYRVGDMTLGMGLDRRTQ